MLVSPHMSLLYNIVDRVYIARIPDVGTTALGAVGLCFPIIVIITAFSNLFGTGGAPIFSIERGQRQSCESRTSDEYILYPAGIMRGYPDDRRTALCQTDSGTFWCF